MSMEMNKDTLAFLEGMKEPVVPFTPFEEYAEKFKGGFILRRENGICEIRMHSKGDSAVFGASKHAGWSQVLKAVGEDPGNEVVIITGTGNEFVRPIPEDLLEIMAGNTGEITVGTVDSQTLQQYELYLQGLDLIRNVITQISVPTIGVINGPAGAMSALGLLCDITIASDTATFEEAHFAQNLVPADGTFQAYEGIMGIKRSAYLCYTHQVIDAKTALDWGLVNEVLPFEETNARAWEIAEQIMKTDKFARNITHAVFREYYAKMIEQLPLQFGFEAWAVVLSRAQSRTNPTGT